MGLDYVELIISVENEFKIAIPDDDVGKCDTVGKLVDYVYSRMQHNKNGPCPSQRGFYVVRRTLMEQLGLPRSEIKPEARLENLIPELSRLWIWEKLIRTLSPGCRFWRTMLVRPKWARLIIFPISPLITVVALYYFIPVDLKWTLLFAAILAMIITSFMTIPFKTFLPKNYSTVADLIKLVNTVDSASWTQKDVFRKIRDIASEISGLAPEEITMKSFFIKDLGFD